MKFENIVSGIALVEHIFNKADIDCFDADVRIVTFQDGANGPLRERLEMKKKIDCAGTEICISFTTPRDLGEVDQAKCTLSPEDVRRMTPKEVRENYANIIRSMRTWR